MAPPRPAEKRCGTCELLSRSTFPGLHTFGKCPHRDGWVRTHHAACEHHASGRGTPLVRALMVLNVAIATAGLTVFAVVDLLCGNLLSHVLLGVTALVLVAFAWLVRRFDLLSEEPKYLLLDEDDPPPPEHDWLDLR